MRFCGFPVLLLGSFAFAAEPTDPKVLTVPAERNAEAVALIAKLDDGDVAVRDKANDKLKGMGRDALPALLAAMKGKPSAEVQVRLEQLLPAARKADFDDRADVFLADKDRKFDHDLPGWSELKAAAKDSKESRLLMTDILRDEGCRAMLLQAFDTTVAGRKAFERRWQAKYEEWSAEYKAGQRPGGPWSKADDPLHWMLAALLADLLYQHDYTGVQRNAAVREYAERTDEGKLAVADKGRYGSVTRQLGRHWCEQQTEVQGLIDAQPIARYMKLGKEVERACAERQFELYVTTGRGGVALSTLAYTRDPKYIASFRRLFESDAIYRAANERFSLAEIQARDAALSMSIALTQQDPREYGFTADRSADANSVARYDTHNYSFKDGDGKTADEKRKAAFKKWAEWEKANPDAIKAKPPEKKEK